MTKQEKNDVIEVLKGNFLNTITFISPTQKV